MVLSGGADVARPIGIDSSGQAALFETPLHHRAVRLRRAVGELYLVMDRIEQTANTCERAPLFRSLHAAAETLRELRVACAAPEAAAEVM